MQSVSAPPPRVAPDPIPQNASSNRLRDGDIVQARSKMRVVHHPRVPFHDSGNLDASNVVSGSGTQGMPTPAKSRFQVTQHKAPSGIKTEIDALRDQASNRILGAVHDSAIRFFNAKQCNDSLLRTATGSAVGMDNAQVDGWNYEQLIEVVTREVIDAFTETCNSLNTSEHDHVAELNGLLAEASYRISVLETTITERTNAVEEVKKMIKIEAAKCARIKEEKGRRICEIRNTIAAKRKELREMEAKSTQVDERKFAEAEVQTQTEPQPPAFSPSPPSTNSANRLIQRIKMTPTNAEFIAMTPSAMRALLKNLVMEDIDSMGAEVQEEHPQQPRGDKDEMVKEATRTVAPKTAEDMPAVPIVTPAASIVAPAAPAPEIVATSAVSTTPTMPVGSDVEAKVQEKPVYNEEDDSRQSPVRGYTKTSSGGSSIRLPVSPPQPQMPSKPKGKRTGRRVTFAADVISSEYSAPVPKEEGTARISLPNVMDEAIEDDQVRRITHVLRYGQLPSSPCD